MKNIDLNKNGRQDTYFKFIIIFLLFLLLVFDRDLATIYLLMMFGDWVWYQSSKVLSYPLTRRTSGLMPYIEGLAATGIFLIISTFLVSALDPQSIITGGVLGGAQSIFHLLSQATPILQNSVILTIIGWGILIPFIETSFFFGRLLEGFSRYAEGAFKTKIHPYVFSASIFLVLLTVSALFTVFHITAKGLSPIPLMITFIFAIISCLLVIRHKELKGAVFMHVVVNMAAVLALQGII